MIESGKLYDFIEERLLNGCLMGCSISAKNSKEAEGDAGNGLIERHAYSILGVITIKADKDTQLIILRNPWGKGEWEGQWSDSCPKKDKYKDKIEEEWKKFVERKKVVKNVLVEGENEVSKENIEKSSVEICNDEDNGIFLMSFDDWKNIYSQLFMCINFPEKYRGYRIRGEWNDNNSGGNILASTWKMNPKYEFEVTEEEANVHIELCQKDLRYLYGKDYSKENKIISFHIVDGDFDFSKDKVRVPKFIPGCEDERDQVTYSIEDTISLDAKLKKGIYIIVVSTYEMDQFGEYTINIYSDDKKMYVEDSEIIAEEEEEEDVNIVKKEKRSYNTGTNMKEYEKAKRYYIRKIFEKNMDVENILNNYNKLSDKEKEKVLNEDEFIKELLDLGFTNEEIVKEKIDVLGGEDKKFTLNDIIVLFERANKLGKFLKFKEKHVNNDDLSGNGQVTNIKDVVFLIYLIS